MCACLAEQTLENIIGPFQDFCAVPRSHKDGKCATNGRALGYVTILDPLSIGVLVSLVLFLMHIKVCADACVAAMRCSTGVCDLRSWRNMGSYRHS